MTKNQFLYDLRRRLRALPQSEIDAAVDYYDAYITDLGDEAAAIAALGSTKSVAAEIIAQFAVSGGTEPENPDTRRANKGMKTAFVTVLAVFAAPVGLPVAVAVGAVLLALAVSLFAVFCSLGITGVVLLPAGLVYVILGVYALFYSPPMGLWMIGVGLFALGAGYLLTLAVAELSRRVFGGLGRVAGRFIMRSAAKIKAKARKEV
ncbi:MAG: DUF1700 domain-containing protein [Oscillospiraceae bacterium]|jgi:uncharacterized membrane protein|nr:DUF1700 domain-containing protein [Oscillospiraceae bacterium]